VSAEENEALVWRYFEEAWVKRNLATADEFMVPNYVEHQIPDGLLTGFYSSLRAANSATVGSVSLSKSAYLTLMVSV
jgi:hypothetical protein